MPRTKSNRKRVYKPRCVKISGFDTLPEPTWQDKEYGISLYCADCLDILPLLPKVDAIVTDPPYGIKEAAGKNKSRGCLAISRDYGDAPWDNTTADVAVALSIDAARYAIVFGGNYYNLPPTSCMLVWDKENGATDFADCEIAWTNLDKASRLLRHLWHGMLRKGKEKRGYHPTQKPVGVMEWCIGHLPRDADTILDPFMGSGTTGVACINLGRSFIGIELEPKYFDISVERIKKAIGHKKMELLPIEEVRLHPGSLL